MVLNVEKPKENPNVLPTPKENPTVLPPPTPQLNPNKAKLPVLSNNDAVAFYFH